LFNASRDYRKKGEECSVCGMDLTEPVTVEEEPAAEDTTVVAATPLSTSSFSVDEILNNYLKLKTLIKTTQRSSNCKVKNCIAL
jgi:hypothetical protein